MSDEEFEAILAELKRLRKAITDSVDEIVHQESEIQALHWLLQHKGIATQEELDTASEEGARHVEILLRSGATGLDVPHRVPARPETGVLCRRGGHHRGVVRPRTRPRP
ncbi:MAG TPA: hypothetical protein VEU96_06890 [Bryobacteraceae bacterium]|nr:hypothetical protein [Bryobacteraceae bacterium]